MANLEQDIRLEILNTLLTTPHRNLAQTHPVHARLIERDPRFYVRLAAWYFDHGDVRDHKEMFIVHLVLSSFEGHRNVGLAMLRRLPPYQVVRVVDFIHGRKRRRRARPSELGRAVEEASQPQRKTILQRFFAQQPEQSVTQVAVTPGQPVSVTDDFGLFRNVPRAMRTEITRYLREREADADWFDGSVLTARKAMKRLYALLHVKPNERAQQILFDNDPPRDSRVFALRQLAAADNPAEQAAAIVQNRIPYRVASTVIKQMTPTVLVALIDRMSPQELINNMGSLRRRGALDVAEIKELVEAKLHNAKTANRVSAFKAEQAVAAAEVSADLREALEDVADAQVKAKGRITRPTALFIDKSSSMDVSIELGKRIGAMVSAVCEKDLFAYVFDSIAYEVHASGPEMAAWERAMKGIKASGCTSCGVAFKYLIRNKQYVEQIVMITDEGDNTFPTFVAGLNEYRQAMKADPAVCIVRTPQSTNHVEQQCRAHGIEVNVFQFSGDYYSLPNLIPLLTRPSKLELLMEIMDYPLPERQVA